MLEENLKNLNFLSDPIVIVDNDQKITWINSSIENLFCYNKEELINKPITILCPEKDYTLKNYIKRHFNKNLNTQENKEFHVTSKDKTEFIINVNLIHLKNTPVNSTIILIKKTFVYEKKKDVEKLKILILEKITQNESTNLILKHICQLVENQNKDTYIVINCFNEEKLQLHNLTTLSLPETFTNKLNHIKVANLTASCGTAAYRKKEVIVTDISESIYWKKYKKTAKEHNLIACWSTPIISSKEQLLGTLAIYRKKNNNFKNINKEIINTGIKLTKIILEKEYLDKKKQEAKTKLENYTKDLKKLVYEKTSDFKENVIELQNSNKNLKIEVIKRKTAEAKIKNALKKEKELNELKTKFLSLVSHEFKTPLSGISTSTMLLSKYTKESQQNKRDKHIKTITSKVKYLNNIITDFLSVENLDVGKIKYNFSTFNTCEIISEIINDANSLLKENQKIVYSKNSEIIYLNQDKKIIKLALSNLINNAIKYSPKNTTININVITSENSTEFMVSDNGIGIPRKDQKNIFNRYFRAENALTTQGTGIGLNIIKNHIENLKGSIFFESKENKGSKFTIILPNINI